MNYTDTIANTSEHPGAPKEALLVGSRALTAPPAPPPGGNAAPPSAEGVRRELIIDVETTPPVQPGLATALESTVVAHISSTPEYRLAREITTLATRQQRHRCAEAYRAALVMGDSNSSDAMKEAAGVALGKFIEDDLRIDVTGPPRRTRATSDPGELARIEPFDYFGRLLGLLRLRSWSSDGVRWPVAFLREALRKAAHQRYVRLLERQRSNDGDVMPLAATDVVDGDDSDDADADTGCGGMARRAIAVAPAPAAVECVIGVECAAFLNLLRSSGDESDIELAETVEAWLHGTSKVALGDARYQRMRYRLKTPRVRAVARRVGLHQDVPTPEDMLETMTLPHGVVPPGWLPGYRTEWGAMLPVSAFWLKAHGCKLSGELSIPKMSSRTVSDGPYK